MEKKLTKKELLMQLKNLGLVVIGTLVLAFGCAVFVVPFDLVTGGVTGISIIIDELIGGLLPIDALTFYHF